MIKITGGIDNCFISIDELKQNLRILNTLEDYKIQALCNASCAYVEEVSGLVLSEHEYTLTLAGFAPVITLPVNPVKEIVSVSYYDDQDALQTIDIADLEISLEQYCTTISYDFPETATRTDAVTIVFNSGLPDGVKYPENLKHAAILLASHWFENRSAAGDSMKEIPFGVDTLINLSKTGWF